MWHFDHPVADYGGQLPAVRVFAFLEPVLPHGGGTLFVAGAHRVAMALAGKGGPPVPSAKIREMLKADHPWFDRLWDTRGDDVRGLLGNRARVHGVEVRVEEMTGEAGDIFVMHPLMLHGAAHNALQQPRLMLAQTLYRQSRKGSRRYSSPFVGGVGPACPEASARRE
jgi:ectoine hydroxylase-related dioxygenase (phytanoyl-CoA dioxygenase family)